jgi:nucleotide-binding universal stress UspA family protein
MSPTTTTAAAGAAYQRPASITGPILLALTGEDTGRHAIETARRLAARTRAAVQVVTAVEPPTPGFVGLDGVPVWWPEPAAYVARRRAQIVDQLRAVGADAGASPVDVLVDAPAHAIVESARARHASMIVMGVGRHDMAARLFGGEVTLRAIRRAAAPVLAVAGAPLEVPVPVAVAAIDFSPSSVRAAHDALDLVADGGVLHLVHVWARQPLDYPAPPDADAAYERALPTRFAQVERALLDRARSVTIIAASLEGAPVPQLLAYARAHGADLIAAGRSGHGLLERLLVGRVTTGLVRAAPCAVLVTPEPSPVEREALERALGGTSASRKREEWPALLDAFSRRNQGRRTRLEVDDPDVGAQAEETGYVLRGATYDRHDARVALMFGAPGSRSHLTRAVDDVTMIAVHADPTGRDVALAVTRGAGQTLLTFLPDPA